MIRLIGLLLGAVVLLVQLLNGVNEFDLFSALGGL